MRRIEPAEPVDPIKQIGRDALHHLMRLTEHVRMQPAKIGHACGRAHAAEKAIALDQQRAAAARAAATAAAMPAGPPPRTTTSYSP